MACHVRLKRSLSIRLNYLAARGKPCTNGPAGAEPQPHASTYATTDAQCRRGLAVRAAPEGHTSTPRTHVPRHCLRPRRRSAHAGALGCEPSADSHCCRPTPAKADPQPALHASQLRGAPPQPQPQLQGDASTNRSAVLRRRRSASQSHRYRVISANPRTRCHGKADARSAQRSPGDHHVCAARRHKAQRPGAREKQTPQPTTYPPKTGPPERAAVTSDSAEANAEPNETLNDQAPLKPQ